MDNPLDWSKAIRLLSSVYDLLYGIFVVMAIKKRPAHLSIVERLGGFWCCKGKAFIWIVQGFWKKVRKWRWFLTDVGCFGRPGDCPLASSTACSILHQSMTRAIFPSLSCCHRRTHGNSTTVRYLATMCQISHATESNLTWMVLMTKCFVIRSSRLLSDNDKKH